jgi:hypothetical protein
VAERLAFLACRGPERRDERGRGRGVIVNVIKVQQVRSATRPWLRHRRVLGSPGGRRVPRGRRLAGCQDPAH